MKRNILLVEPAYKNPYPPLGLMKISTWHQNQGDNVTFIKDVPHNLASCSATQLDLPLSDAKGLLNSGHPSLERKNFDVIYITSLFTYQAKEVRDSILYFREKYPKAEIKVGGIMATLLPKYIEENTGIKPHIGLLDEAENCSPDYSLVPGLKCSITFTTRGCPRKCGFCSVRLHEPEFFVKENWENDIDVSKSRIIFWDNNWLVSPNFEKDIEKIKKLGKIVDFNQGLDCRLFDEDKAKLLSTIRIKPLRFAFDNSSEEEYIQNAVKIAQKHGFKDIRVYILYNSLDPKDTPEYFYYRINEMNRLGALSYPMRYRPINSVNGRYISPNWDNKLLRALKLSLIFYYTGGLIRKNREAFEEIYKKNANEFKKKLYEIYEGDKLRKKQKSKHSTI